MNYIISISYNGFFFKGSQSQLNFSTIHDNFIFFFFKFNKKINKIKFSSRTDKGVNSLLQIIQLYSKKYYFKNKLINYFNYFNKYINVLNIIQITKKFHSLYSIISRIYCYIFSFNKNIFFNYSFFLNINFNIYLLICLLKHILGLKNFFIFDSYKNFFFYKSVRIIYEINIYKKNNYLYFIVKGNSFLYNMIRNIISFLIYLIYNNYNLCIFYNFFYSKNYLFFLKPINSNFLFLIYINYLL